ncbi:MAG TPA: hypothetical protein PKC19_23540, partial [Roseiflexaceae bacterium]|nr:hypothetical protein [Roseiflexaceae bacterium]
MRLWFRTILAAAVMLAFVSLLAACGGDDGSLYVPDLIERPQEFNGREVVVSGAYISRPNTPGPVLALGVSTLDNGLDAQPLGEQIFLEGFPEAITANLHRPGDAVYGFVRVSGRFETGGGYGPDAAFQHRISVVSAEAIDQIRRTEVRIPDAPAAAGQVSLFDLVRNPAAHSGQVVTTRGYYFWNSVIYVLAEGISTEEDGSSPQPVGAVIWMEGFPPDVSADLTIGPNNSYVWGLVEVTGEFSGGGGFCRGRGLPGQPILIG